MLSRSQALPGERELISVTTLLGLVIAVIIYQSTSLVLGPQSRQIALSLSLVQQPAEQIAEPIENGFGEAASLFAAITVVPAERLVSTVRLPLAQSLRATVSPVPQPAPAVQTVPTSQSTDKSSRKTHSKKPVHASLVAQLHGHQSSVTA